MKKKVVFLSLFLSYSMYGLVFAAVIGSNSAVSLQALANFPAADSDNEMRGFAYFQNGFTLEDNTTTCTFNSYFPITDTITMNGGIVYLAKDVQLRNIVTIANGGTFWGNSHCLSFPALNTGSFDVPESTIASEKDFTFDQITLELNSTVCSKGEWLFKNSAKIVGNGHTLDLSDGGSIKVRKGSSLELEGVKVIGLKESNFECLADDASIILQNCILQLERDLTFSHGSLLFQKDVVISGTNQFNYSSGITSTIDSHSTLSIEKNTTLKFSSNAARKDLLYMTDKSSVIYFDGSSLHTTSTALKISEGMILIDNKVTFSNEGSNTGEAIEIASDVALNILGGADLGLYGYFRFD